mmetsp:Transcript_97247/g.197526  ORF Transcript_97247/g.197526 Transcript_97247/m.197526 type:complete len:214 (-) Transcript_97247:81-722(-)
MGSRVTGNSPYSPRIVRILVPALIRNSQVGYGRSQVQSIVLVIIHEIYEVVFGNGTNIRTHEHKIFRYHRLNSYRHPCHSSRQINGIRIIQSPVHKQLKRRVQSMVRRISLVVTESIVCCGRRQIILGVLDPELVASIAASSRELASFIHQLGRYFGIFLIKQRRRYIFGFFRNKQTSTQIEHINSNERRSGQSPSVSRHVCMFVISILQFER